LACQNWLDAKAATARQNAKARALFEIALDEWWERAQAHQKLQRRENVKIDKFRSRYAQGKPDAVIEFLDAVLSHSQLPGLFPARWELGFCAEAGALIIDYDLPPPEGFPSLTAVRFDVLHDIFEERHLSEAEVAQLYDSAIRQACLRILHDVAAADEADVLASVAFNGWIGVAEEFRDRPKRICVISVEAAKAAINLEISGSIDPKAKFKSLGGTAGENLSDLATVAPVRLPKGAQVWTMAAHDDVHPYGETHAPSPAPLSNAAQRS
jgi:restriction system protein